MRPTFCCATLSLQAKKVQLDRPERSSYWEVFMSDNAGSKVTYFLVGLGVGALVGILFAPKSGDETREFLSKKADEGKDYAQRKARELRERADELIERGKDVASKQKESISAAVEGAREAYRREAGKA